MELQIQAKNLELNEQVRNHASQKLGQLVRQLPSITNAIVELTSEPTRSQKDRVVAQVTLDVDGSILRSEQRAANTRSAINAAADVLSRLIERYKSRTYRSERGRRAQSQLPDTPDTEPIDIAASPYAQSADSADGESDLLPQGDLVRVKRFDMPAMTVEEAAVQMQLLGHQFFMFLNDETGAYNVLYQRRDGDLGLIQPKS